MDRRRFEQMLTRRTSRRLFLAAGAGAAGLTATVSLAGRPTRTMGVLARLQEGTPAAAPATTARFGANPFSLGVASGDPLPEGVVLWTRLAPTPLGGGGMDPVPYEVGWEVANDEGFTDIIQTGTAVASRELAHSVHVDVTGLEPAREYFYRFAVGGAISPVGRTKTAPAAGAAVDVLNFGVASRSHYEHGYFTAYRHMAAQNFDLVFHVGDYIYEYGPGEYSVREGDPLREVVGEETIHLGDYRTRYAQYRTDLDLQAAHASAPWVVTWDDHETENNYADEISENDEARDTWLARRAAAYQAYYEHMPLRPASISIGPDMQLYRRLTYGNLAEFSVLDTRQYRSNQPCGDGISVRCAEALDPNQTLTGPEQERWLLEGLDASTATWNVIPQQVMMAQLDTDPGDSLVVPMDMWDGYPAARNRILAHIQSRGISNAVVLTGDIHTSWANDLKMDFEDPASATVATEYVCTSITSGGEEPADFGGNPSTINPHIKFFDPHHGGYTAVQLTPELWTATFRTVDKLSDENSGLTEIGTFVTEAGVPGVQPA